MKFLKIAFHVHTEYSRDSSFKVKDLLALCRKHEVQVLIITDHNHMEGYQAAKEEVKKQQMNILLIPAEEIATEEGEVIGIYLKKSIPKGLSLKETMQQIKNQGGLVCIPHPFDTVRRERIKNPELLNVYAEQIDLIEVFNSRNLKPGDNQKAEDWAEKFEKTKIWGSDAHFAYEFHHCFFQIPEFENYSEKFLEAMKLAQKLNMKRSFAGFFQSILKKYLLFGKF